MRQKAQGLRNQGLYQAAEALTYPSNLNASKGGRPTSAQSKVKATRHV
jgi:hypothetical protein